MTIENIMFWVFAPLAIISAYAMVTHRSIVYSALFLILVFLSIAGIFVLNNADFLAIAQMIVYAVGLTIILMFGVMFTGDHHRFESAKPVPKSQIWLFGMVATMVGTLLVGIAQFPYQQSQPTQGMVNTIRVEGTTGLLGQLIFQQYVVPFELASVLLLVAMVGAILIAKRKLEVSTDAWEDSTRLPLNHASVPYKTTQDIQTESIVSSAVTSL